MKIFKTFKKLVSLGAFLYKKYDELPEEKKEKVNQVISKAAVKAIESM